MSAASAEVVQPTPADVITERVAEHYAPRRFGRHKSSRAGELGHPCDRRLYLLRTEGSQRDVAPMGLMRMQRGRSVEEETLRTLTEAGLEVSKARIDIDNRDLEIGGKIDLWLGWGREVVPLEVKLMPEFVFDSVETVGDVLASKYTWIRKYPGQLLVYLMEPPPGVRQADHGVLILRSDRGKWKALTVRLWDHVDHAEAMLARAERVRDAIRAEREPDRPNYVPEMCDRCDFFRHCWGEERPMGPLWGLVEDPEVRRAAEDWVRTHAAKRAHKAADDYLKGRARATDFGAVTGPVICGPVTIRKKRIEPRGKTPYDRIDITPIEESSSDE